MTIILSQPQIGVTLTAPAHLTVSLTPAVVPVLNVSVSNTVVVRLEEGGTGGGHLPEVELLVERTGQTRWNIGGAEPRRGLSLNNIDVNINQEYTISLPFLDWISPVILDASDQLLLKTN